jgi:regulator of protease activity HflC (stomatin/prohibitin superfamily)
MDFVVAPLASLFFGVAAYVVGSVKIINEGEAALVERFGRYQRTLAPGLNFTLPVVDTIIIDTTREQVFDVPAQDAMTADSVYVKTDAVVYWKIENLRLVHYGVDNIKEAIENLALTTIRSEIGRLTLDQTFTSRSTISTTLLDELNRVADTWGVEIKRVEVKDILPNEDVIRELEKVRIAEAGQKARIADAEGRRREAMAQSESRREASVAEAKGLVEAMELISDAMKDRPEGQQALQDLIKFLMAQRYVEANQKIGESNNSKILFMDPNALNQSLDHLINHSSDNALPGGGRRDDGV